MSIARLGSLTQNLAQLPNCHTAWTAYGLWTLGKTKDRERSPSPSQSTAQDRPAPRPAPRPAAPDPSSLTRPRQPPGGDGSDQEDVASPYSGPTSASKALAASLAAPKGSRSAEGMASASLRDGFLSVSGLDAGGSLDLQGLLLEGLRESLANLTPAQLMAAGAQASMEQATETAESSAPRRVPRKRP
ncbi:hypothetical protein AK812_SmicGene34966 [Symbiodinium microadriaticum]|uniref:Uncharacterized protein n=1 Tax=Symbiodinium microadriaticum TaxID=2951 RepID=A0A1Q9CMP7_SYMMI|nr:hypothetical protein AK812_SmicGene34966 [Symbiodinium microadriaticum]